MRQVSQSDSPTVLCGTSTHPRYLSKIDLNIDYRFCSPIKLLKVLLLTDDVRTN